MFRVGLSDDEVREFPDDNNIGDEEEEPKRDLNAYFKTEEGHYPIIALARFLGFFPSCFKYPLAVQLGVQHELADKCHRFQHFMGWVHGILVFITMLFVVVGSSAYLIGTQYSPELSDYFATFDIITYSECCLFLLIFFIKTADFGWFMSSMDFFVISFENVSFLRTDIAELMIKEKRNRLEDDHDNMRAYSGRPHMSEVVDEATNAILGDDSLHHSRSRTAHSRTFSAIKAQEEFENRDFGDIYVKKVRMYTLLACTVFGTVWFVFLGFLMFCRLSTTRSMVRSGSDWKIKAPQVVTVQYLKWFFETFIKPQWSLDVGVTVTGMVLDCINISIQLVPALIFASHFLDIVAVLDEFNDRVRMARESYLEIDRAVMYHHRIKTLVSRMEKCLGIVVFVIIAGDFFCVISGTFLGFWRSCNFKTLDVICWSYLARHLLIIVRLLFIGGCGSVLQYKLNYTLILLDGYMSKAILNTERLKIMGLLTQSGNNAFSIGNFFSLTRPFYMALVTGSIAYTALVIRITEKH